MKTVQLPLSAAQAVTDYLASRPYREVFQLIAAIGAAPVVEAKTEALEASDAAP